MGHSCEIHKRANEDHETARPEKRVSFPGEHLSKYDRAHIRLLNFIMQF